MEGWNTDISSAPKHGGPVRMRVIVRGLLRDRVITCEASWDEERGWVPDPDDPDADFEGRPIAWSHVSSGGEAGSETVDTAPLQAAATRTE